ncbi:MAG TPA: serine/threonine-protein kinase, partial [Planctomycetota bacterium]|nr:serine/threonine-protein kinase [Planctomycetota bacterium]
MTAPVSRFGPWVAEGVLGRGSYGVVHRVRHGRTGELAALKAMRIGSDDPRAVRRFEREVEVLRRLDAPGVVRVLDAGVQDGLPWAALELVDGKTLAEAPLSLPEWVAVLARVARAVGAVHRAGVAHRDLKPTNVILASETGAVKVIDFGLAFDATSDASRLSQPGEVAGTPAYMAPEVVRGDASPDDPRRDVYALGVMLHERLAGENPFAVGSGHMGLVMERILRGPPELARRAGLDPTLARIADRACAADRASRHPDGDALAAELEAWLGGGARESPVRDRRGILVAGGLVVVAVAAIALVSSRRGGDGVASLAPRDAAVVSSRAGGGSSTASAPLAVPGREVTDLIELLEAHFERGGLERDVLARCRSFVSRSPRDSAARFVDVVTRTLEDGSEFEARRELVRLLRDGAVPARALGVTCRIFCTLGFDRAACGVGDETLPGDAVRPPSLRAEEMRVRIVSEAPVAWAERAEALAQGLLS